MFRTCVLVLASVAAAQASDALYESFRDPPAAARPFVRWWWNGNRVTEREIVRELEVMKAAGIGGVEINPIAMPEGVAAGGLEKFPALEWLSPEWNAMAALAARRAGERGMTADLIVGSGWPFGGRFLSREEQIQRITLVKRELAGPRRWQATAVELYRSREGERRDSDGTVSVEPRLAFLRLVPAGTAGFDPGKDIAVRPDGAIDLDVPEGRFVLYAGFHEIGFSHVKLGAPGADGPVVDHLNAKAVRNYLDHMSSKLGPAMGGKLGARLRAMFVDSLELDRENWTGDFAAEFERRRGYPLAPYLPFVLDRDLADDTVRRARYDFCRTLIELFRERFVRTYIEWCHENGLLGRIQAYGRETHPLEGSMLADLPEGETWLWGDQERIVPMPTVVNKYVSSGAHLAGKRLVSFEAMTNAVPVFRETLEDFKLGLDMSLLSGVNHPVLHGFNFTPPEAGFPGWVRFGCYFNEKSPWWPHFHLWADYAARLSSVLRETTATAQVAILGPRADEWSRAGLLYQPFPEVLLPWYHYHLWQALGQQGVSSDFVSESVVEGATVEGGRLAYNGRQYEAIVLEDVESLEPATARAIGKYAAAGGTVVFIGRAPARSPGLKDAAANDELVRRAVQGALSGDGRRVTVIEGPRQQAAAPAGDVDRLGLPLPDRLELLNWAGSMLARFGIRREVRISTPSPSVSYIHHRAGKRDLFFFANTDRKETAAFEAEFPTGSKRPWRWDPLTGRREVYPYASAPDRLSIELGPEESLLLVFEPGEGAPPAAGAARVRIAGEFRTIDAPWRVSFLPVNGQAPFERTIERLVDLSKAPDPALSAFAGSARYAADFDVPDARFTVVDLGGVYNVSEVALNGKALGVRWYGAHVYDAGAALRAGRNHLEITVTTMLGNYAKSLQAGNPMAKRWAFWFPPIPAGLVGPVRIGVPAP